MIFAKFARGVVRPIAAVLYPSRAIGQENIPTPEEAPRLIVCSNHIHFSDPVHLLLRQKRWICFMAKAELFHNPIVGWLLRKLGAFAVNRGKGDTGAIDAAREIVESGKIMGIFPEGTRSKDGTLGRAKSGAALIAAQTGATVLPVAIIAKDQRVRMFRRCTVAFGKPISPEELHLDNPEHPDLRYASRLIMSRIGEMIEEAGNKA